MGPKWYQSSGTHDPIKPPRTHPDATTYIHFHLKLTYPIFHIGQSWGFWSPRVVSDQHGPNLLSKFIHQGPRRPCPDPPSFHLKLMYPIFLCAKNGGSGTQGRGLVNIGPNLYDSSRTHLSLGPPRPSSDEPNYVCFQLNLTLGILDNCLK